MHREGRRAILLVICIAIEAVLTPLPLIRSSTPALDLSRSSSSPRRTRLPTFSQPLPELQDVSWRDSRPRRTRRRTR